MPLALSDLHDYLCSEDLGRRAAAVPRRARDVVYQLREMRGGHVAVGQEESVLTPQQQQQSYHYEWQQPQPLRDMRGGHVAGGQQESMLPKLTPQQQRQGCYYYEWQLQQSQYYDWTSRATGVVREEEARGSEEVKMMASTSRSQHTGMAASTTQTLG